MAGLHGAFWVTRLQGSSGAGAGTESEFGSRAHSPAAAP